MAHQVLFTRAADRALETIDATDRRRILRRVEALGEAPRPNGAVKLRGEESRYRVRVGNYRIIYEVDDLVVQVLVIRIGHRREVYR